MRRRGCRSAPSIEHELFGADGEHDRNLYGFRSLNGLTRGGAQHLQAVEGLGHDPAAAPRQEDQALAQTGEVLLDDEAPDRASLSPVAVLKMGGRRAARFEPRSGRNPPDDKLTIRFAPRRLSKLRFIESIGAGTDQFLRQELVRARHPPRQIPAAYVREQRPLSPRQITVALSFCRPPLRREQRQWCSRFLFRFRLFWFFSFPV